MYPPAIFILGPTSVGKTTLAIELSKIFPCEIISVDSVSVYREMDIGTAKPDKSLLKQIPYHLIDIKDPTERYSAAEFRISALNLMKKITSSRKIPILVGGSMMYFKILINGLDMPINNKIRISIQNESLQKGVDLYQQLLKIDKDSAQRIHPNDFPRVIRALEIYKISGLPMSRLIQLNNSKKKTLPYNIAKIAIMVNDRNILYNKIKIRLYKMLDEGFLNEVRKLYTRKDLNITFPSMQAVGYKQMWNYLDGYISYTDMIERSLIATRHLAKKQITWLKKCNNLYLIDETQKCKISTILKYLKDKFGEHYGLE